jgi:hypothetical protein
MSFVQVALVVGLIALGALVVIAPCWLYCRRLLDKIGALEGEIVQMRQHFKDLREGFNHAVEVERDIADGHALPPMERWRRLLDNQGGATAATGKPAAGPSSGHGPVAAGGGHGRPAAS